MEELLKRTELQKTRQRKRVIFIVGLFLAFLGGFLLGINVSKKEAPKSSEMAKKPLFEEVPEEPLQPPSKPQGNETQGEPSLTFYQRLQEEAKEKPKEEIEQRPKEEPKKEAPKPEPQRPVKETGASVERADRYAFQVASFREMKNAQEFVQRLLSKGIRAEVQKTEIKGMVWYRVIVRAQNREESQKIKELLKNEGIKEVKFYEEKTR
jgi:cell division protein FtsN